MNYESAKEKLQIFPTQYVIIGFKSDGKRGIPPTYEMDVVAASNGNVFDELKKFHEARVFSISEIGTPEHWKQKMKDHFDSQTQKEEIEKLKELRKKYPTV